MEPDERVEEPVEGDVVGLDEQIGGELGAGEELEGPLESVGVVDEGAGHHQLVEQDAVGVETRRLDPGADEDEGPAPLQLAERGFHGDGVPRAFQRDVEGLGGEGLMMRKPKSKYEIGRSSTLLKVKTFHDAEARVLKHLPGAGRHKGRMGALQVELADGTTFSVGTGFSDAERGNPPAVGSMITFRYQELSEAGVPRFPSYVGVREDGGTK